MDLKIDIILNSSIYNSFIIIFIFRKFNYENIFFSRCMFGIVNH